MVVENVVIGCKRPPIDRYSSEIGAVVFRDLSAGHDAIRPERPAERDWHQ